MVCVIGESVIFLLCFSLALTDMVRNESMERIDKFVCYCRSDH